MTAISPNVDSLVQGLVSDLTALIRTSVVEAVSTILDPGKAVRVAVPRPVPRQLPKVRHAPQRRSPALFAKHKAAVLAYVVKNPGKGGGKIREALKLRDADWRSTSQMLKDAGLLRVKGEKTKAVWFARAVFGTKPVSKPVKKSVKKSVGKKK